MSNEQVAVKAENTRVSKWDNAKLVLMFFVVLGHLINETVLYSYREEYSMLEKWVFFIYTFHMPAFIFISGLFSKKTVDNKRYDKIGSYLRLYFVMTFVVFFSKFIARGKAPYVIMYEIGVPWYALALFSMYLIMIFLKPYSKIEMVIGTMILGMLVGYDRRIGSYLVLSRTLTFLPFFVVGYYLDAKKLLEFLEKKWVKISSAVILVVYGIIVHLNIEPMYYLYKNFLKGRSTYRSTFKIAIVGEGWNNAGFFFRFLYYIIAFVIMMAFFSLIPNKKNPLTKFGGRTLGVFAIHFGVLTIMIECFNYNKMVQDVCVDNQWLAMLILLGSTILIQGILSIKPIAVFMNKIMSTPNSTAQDKKEV